MQVGVSLPGISQVFILKAVTLHQNRAIVLVHVQFGWTLEQLDEINDKCI